MNETEDRVLRHTDETCWLMPEDQRRTVSQDNHFCPYWHSSIVHVARHTMFRGYMNILFLFVPLGIAADMFAWAPGFVFTFNLLAILPLAKLLNFTLKKLSTGMNPLLGGIFNVVFSNAILLIVSLSATVC